MVDQKIVFDYHYEEEAERYAFFRIPKALFTEPIFRDLSDGAKVLYGQLLDLMPLSKKNGWIDKDGRVYVRCKIDKIKKIMNCSNAKAVKMLMELDTATGVGLIEKVKMGQGNATLIYVKSFVIMRNISTEKSLNKKEITCENSDSEKQKSSILNSRIPEFRKSESMNSEKQNSRIPKNRIPEFRKSESLNSEKQNSRILKKGILEFRNAEPINTNINNTDFVNPNHINQLNENSEKDVMDEIRDYTKIIKNNIEYDILMQRSSIVEREEIDHMVDIMVDTICIKRKMIKISRADYPFELVKTNLLKLNMFHIEYILESLAKTTSKGRRDDSYMLTTIYKAPGTINNYYRSRVNNEMYGVD